jgi:hypothetical protein
MLEITSPSPPSSVLVAHSAHRGELVFSEAVAAVFLKLGLCIVGLRIVAAEGAFVHHAATPEIAGAQMPRRRTYVVLVLAGNYPGATLGADSHRAGKSIRTMAQLPRPLRCSEAWSSVISSIGAIKS